jgi:hypothetical protein
MIMKYFSILLLSLFATLVSYGQVNMTVMGSISDFLSNQPVVNHSYTITVIENNNTVTYSGTTDSFGFFNDTLVLSSATMGQFPFSVEFLDCDGSTYSYHDTTIASSSWYHTGSHEYCLSAACDVSFTTTVSSDTLVTHTINNPSYGAFNWTLSNGATFLGTSVSYSIGSSGTYSICVTQNDTIANCTATACDTFTITVPPVSCDASFTTTVMFDTVVTHSVTNQAGNTFYQWILPNGTSPSGTTAWTQYLMYNYDTAHSVCLVATDSAGTCSDTVCNTYTAGLIPSYDIYGTVGYNGVPVSEANVYLIEIVNDSMGNILTVVDSTSTILGDYYFDNLPAGSYYVKAALKQTDSLYSNYLPSYYGGVPNSVGELYWSNAGSIAVATGSSINVSFNLVQGNNPGGPGVIGGLVSQGANKTNGPGDPLSGVLILLLDENDQPVGYQISDESGSFEFDNLPLESYTVYAEVTGIPTDAVEYTLTSDNVSTDLIRVEVNSTNVVSFIATTTGVEEFNSKQLSIYPNPVNSVLKITSVHSQDEKAEISIFNLNGTVYLNQVISLEGSNQINVEDLPKGLYILDVKIGSERSTMRFVK